MRPRLRLRAVVACVLSLVLAACGGGRSGERFGDLDASPAAPSSSDAGSGFGALGVTVMAPLTTSRELPPAWHHINLAVTGPVTPPPQQIAKSEVTGGQVSKRFVVPTGSGYSVRAECFNVANTTIATASQADVTVPAEGTVTVRLRLRAQSGGSLTASILATPDPVGVGQAVSFSANVTGAVGFVVRYDWDLDGDGLYEANGQPPMTTRFTSPGQRQVHVSVLDEAGRTATATGTVTVTGDAAVLQVQPVVMDLGAYTSGANFVVSNGGNGVLNWAVARRTAVTWLDLDEVVSQGLGEQPSQGQGNGWVHVQVRRGDLPVQSVPYMCEVLFSQTDGPQTVSCTVLVAVARLGVSVDALDFSSADATRSLTVINTGSGDIGPWGAVADQPWIHLAPASGHQNDELTVTVDRSGLGSGDYSGTVRITTGNSPSNFQHQTVTVRMRVATASLTVRPGSLDFGESLTELPLAVGASFGVLTWTGSTDKSWLTLSPTTGKTPGTVTVKLNRSAISTGGWTGTVRLEAGSSTVQVPVSATVGATTGGVDATIQ